MATFFWPATSFFRAAPKTFFDVGAKSPAENIRLRSARGFFFPAPCQQKNVLVIIDAMAKSSGEKIPLRPALFFYRAISKKCLIFLGRPAAFFSLAVQKKHFGDQSPSEKIPPQPVHGFLFRAICQKTPFSYRCQITGGKKSRSGWPSASFFPRHAKKKHS